MYRSLLRPRSALLAVCALERLAKLRRADPTRSGDPAWVDYLRRLLVATTPQPAG